MRESKEKKYKKSVSKMPWSKDEDFLLETMWGKHPIETICNKIGRSKSAILHRVYSQKLGGFWDNGSYFIVDIAKLLNVDHCVVMRWINKRGLKARKRVMNKDKRIQIEHNTLYEWLKENQNLWNASKLEEMALGKEEEWLIEKRKKDKSYQNKNITYLKEEDEKIIKLYMRGLTDFQISEKMNRSFYGIKHRVKKLRNEGRLPYRQAKRQQKIKVS